MRRPPLGATVFVLVAVAAMIGLGMWQLHRRAWKEALIARYVAASAQTGAVALTGTDIPDFAAYRRVLWDCPEPGADQVVAGRNAQGRSGWAHVVVCSHGTGAEATHVPVVIGWSFAVVPVIWPGGGIAGIAVPGPKAGVFVPGRDGRALDWHIVAEPPLGGLEPNARPNPREIANNHWSYAIQWFAFAATALIIYLLALRRR